MLSEEESEEIPADGGDHNYYMAIKPCLQMTSKIPSDLQKKDYKLHDRIYPSHVSCLQLRRENKNLVRNDANYERKDNKWFSFAMSEAERPNVLPPWRYLRKLDRQSLVKRCESSSDIAMKVSKKKKKREKT